MQENQEMGKSHIFLSYFLIAHLAVAAVVPPLSTQSRWLVDESGRRVKLACVNWPSHLEVMVAEGLSMQPLDEISQEIKNLGFNCVRLTWPLFLFTNDSLGGLKVRQSFDILGLFGALGGLETNNPSIVDLSLVDAYKEVVASLTRKNVMIILDNHTSKPGWCCSSNDGNGFFGDRYFDPDVWVRGLTKVATTFNGNNNVIAMSLRNELRGPRQNVNDWYRYMQSGAEAVHASNPNLLVILSGLSYDRDLSFLGTRQVSLSFSSKLVYELHWYGFSDGQAWASANPNHVCGRIVEDTMRNAGYLLSQGYPLFLSEFGLDMRGTNDNDNRYLNCFMGWAAENDVDWALWALTGSYYLREGVIGFDETYGVYNWNWGEVRNRTIIRKISALQYAFRGNEEAREHKVIFHPMTGLCIERISLLAPLVLGPCSESEAWSYSPENTLTIKGTYFCIQAVGLGQSVKLTIFCNGENTKWEAISDSKMHLSSKLEDGTNVCLDVNSDNTVITSECRCLDNRDDRCDPEGQWFKVINSTRKTERYLSLGISSIGKFIAKSLLGRVGL